jgi:hypothetical protein
MIAAIEASPGKRKQLWALPAARRRRPPRGRVIRPADAEDAPGGSQGPRGGSGWFVPGDDSAALMRDIILCKLRQRDVAWPAIAVVLGTRQTKLRDRYAALDPDVVRILCDTPLGL